MKTFRTIVTTLLFVVLCGLMAACSSNDESSNGGWNENEKGKGFVQSKRLAKTEITSSKLNQQATYFYDADGNISRIHSVYGSGRVSHDISFIITESTIAWNVIGSNGNSEVFRAVIDNGRAQSMTVEDCMFRYDANGQLIEVESGDDNWGRIYILTWNNGNITRLEQREASGTLVSSIDYTYTNYVADNLLASGHLFNPLTENGFLDNDYSMAIFYTGACGKLSKNLPATAKFYIQNHNSSDLSLVLYGERTYEYKTSGEQITSVIIDGYENDNKPYIKYPVMLALTWE